MTTRNDTSSDNGFSGSWRTYSKLLHYGFSETSFGIFLLVHIIKIADTTFSGLGIKLCGEWYLRSFCSVFDIKKGRERYQCGIIPDLSKYQSLFYRSGSVLFLFGNAGESDPADDSRRNIWRMLGLYCIHARLFTSFSWIVHNALTAISYSILSSGRRIYCVCMTA